MQYTQLATKLMWEFWLCDETTRSCRFHSILGNHTEGGDDSIDHRITMHTRPVTRREKVMYQ
jgi:hypothetical protein